MAFPVVVASILVMAGLGAANHQANWPDGDSGDLFNAPFEYIPEFRVTMDWVGLGGPGGDDTRLEVVYLPDGTPFFCCTVSDTLEATDPAPDDCADVDGMFPQAYSRLAVPSVSWRPAIDEGTLLPQQSTPVEVLTTLCTLVREQINGQPPGYRYQSQPQQFGIGEVSYGFLRRVDAVAAFDDALTAFPPSLKAMLCGPSDYQGTASAGDETWADGSQGPLLAAPNGVLLGLPARDCVDLTDAFLAALATRVDAQWDPGTINEQNNGGVYTLDMGGAAPGLYIDCVAALVFDLNNAVFGVFEDYAYFWVDDPPYLLAPVWALPEASDGVAGDQHCDSIGIPI